MTTKLDHFFLLTDPGAPQAELLTEIGMIEGTASSHPGQGTANRRFFFSDSMLELLYVRDANEVVNGPGRRLRMMERTTDESASPFGLIIRASAGSTDEPFPGWRYYPDYFSAGQYLHIGDNTDLLEEPLCVYVPFDLPMPAVQPLSADPFTSVTELHISVPVTRPSRVLETIAQDKRISLRLDEPHRMEVVFNQGKERQSRDLRPKMPLVIHW